MDFWLMLQVRPRDFPGCHLALMEEGLEGCFLLSFFLHLRAPDSLASNSSFPLLMVLFSFSLNCFGLLQLLSLMGLGHLLDGSFLGLQSLLDALWLTGHRGGGSEAEVSSLNGLDCPLGQRTQLPAVLSDLL